MVKAHKNPQIELTRDNLRQFEPISSLSNERLDELVSLSYVEAVNMGVSLFREGDVDNQTIYILKGDVQLTSSKAKDEIIIHSHSKDARFPLDDSQPRQYSAVAMSLVDIVRIDNSVLDYMMMWDQLAVAEETNVEQVIKKETKPDTVSDTAIDTEKQVEQAVLASIENAKVQENNLESVSKVDFNKTIKPELTVKKSKNSKSENEKIAENKNSKNKESKIDKDKKWKKKKNIDSNSQTIVNDAIKKDRPKENKKESEDNKAKDKKLPENNSEKSKVTENKKIEKNNSGVSPIKKLSDNNKEENSIVYESRDWIRKIRQIMAFKNMPPANVKNLLEKMESVNVKKGDRIIEQGSDGDYYYIITDGTAVVTRTIELASLSPGTSFGEEALVAKSPRNASVSMTSDGILMRLSKKDFDDLLIEPMMARVSADEARSKILVGAKWLDVRHAKEFHHSRLPGAINIPLHELRLRMAELDKETEYICCCRTGTRSSSGSFLLAQNGFKVSLLTGGIQVMSQDLRK